MLWYFLPRPKEQSWVLCFGDHWSNDRCSGCKGRAPGLFVVVGGLQLGMEAGGRAKQVWERRSAPWMVLLPTGSRKDQVWRLGGDSGDPWTAAKQQLGRVSAPGFQAPFRYQAMS